MQVSLLTITKRKHYSSYVNCNKKQKQPPEVFCKKMYSQKFCKIHSKTLVPEPEACNFICLYFKRLWHRCVPVNFAKFLKAPFLQNTSGRLLLEKPLYFNMDLIYQSQCKVYGFGHLQIHSFISKAFFTTQTPCCLTFQLIQLQMLFRFCLLHITVIKLGPILYLVCQC